MERVSEYRQQVKAFLQDFVADDPHTSFVPANIANN